MVGRGWPRPRKAQALIMAGPFRAADALDKPAIPFPISPSTSRRRHRSSAAPAKLAEAMDAFRVDPAGLVCLDVDRRRAFSRIACCSGRGPRLRRRRRCRQIDARVRDTRVTLVEERPLLERRTWRWARRRASISSSWTCRSSPFSRSCPPPGVLPPDGGRSSLTLISLNSKRGRAGRPKRHRPRSGPRRDLGRVVGRPRAWASSSGTHPLRHPWPAETGVLRRWTRGGLHPSPMTC
jgi:hypothetical protein